MAAKPVDAIYSFQHVVDSIPQWKESVGQLNVYAAKRHEEFVAEYARLLHKARPKRQKSESVSSIRSADGPILDGLRSSQSSGPLEFVDISPFEAGNRFLYAQAHRKRKPGTSMRSGASGPTKFRSKQMAMIYYDTHIQSELDKLVKAFGLARNNLRKGKNAYTVAKGFQLPSLSRRYDGFDNMLTMSMSRSTPRLTKTMADVPVVTDTTAPSGEAAFSKTDKELEHIQTLCETAAHQAIRDGDCETELDSTMKQLDALLTLAQSALDTLKAEQVKKDEADAASIEASSVSDVANTSSQVTLCEQPSIEAFTIPPKSIPPPFETFEYVKRPPILPASSAPPAPVLADAIEVDDDDDEDDESIPIDLNLKSLRSTARTRTVI